MKSEVRDIDVSDSCQLLRSWFGKVDSLLVLGRGPSALDPRVRPKDYDGVLVADPTYAMSDVYDGEPLAVLIGDCTEVPDKVVARYLSTDRRKRPLLMSANIAPPGEPCHRPKVLEQIPTPVPLLPLLEQAGLYTDDPPYPYPTTGVFMTLVAAALGKRCLVAGIDLYRHPSGVKYVNSQRDKNEPTWPERHCEEVDLRHLRKAKRCLGDRIEIIGVAGEVLRADFVGRRPQNPSEKTFSGND